MLSGVHRLVDMQNILPEQAQCPRCRCAGLATVHPMLLVGQWAVRGLPPNA